MLRRTRSNFYLYFSFPETLFLGYFFPSYFPRIKILLKFTIYPFLTKEFPITWQLCTVSVALVWRLLVKCFFFVHLVVYTHHKLILQAKLFVLIVIKVNWEHFLNSLVINLLFIYNTCKVNVRNTYFSTSYFLYAISSCVAVWWEYIQPSGFFFQLEMYLNGFEGIRYTLKSEQVTSRFVQQPNVWFSKVWHFFAL